MAYLKFNKDELVNLEYSLKREVWRQTGQEDICLLLLSDVIPGSTTDY